MGDTGFFHYVYLCDDGSTHEFDFRLGDDGADMNALMWCDTQPPDPPPMPPPIVIPPGGYAMTEDDNGDDEEDGDED